MYILWYHVRTQAVVETIYIPSSHHKSFIQCTNVYRYTTDDWLESNTTPKTHFTDKASHRAPHQHWVYNQLIRFIQRCSQLLRLVGNVVEQTEDVTDQFLCVFRDLYCWVTAQEFQPITSQESSPQIRLDRNRLDRNRLDQTRLDQIRLDQNRLDWTGPVESRQSVSNEKLRSKRWLVLWQMVGCLN